VFPLNLYARVRIFIYNLHTGPRVQRAPGIPCSLFLEGQTVPAKLGQTMPREGECASLATSQPSSPGLTGRPSTPRLLGSIAAVSGILDRPVKPGDDESRGTAL